MEAIAAPWAPYRSVGAWYMWRSQDGALEWSTPVAEMGWDELHQAVADCRRCPRLVEHRERTALEKRAAYRDEDYWGRAVPGFGDPGASLLIVGLAPAAHGANRTGRMFTGDRSGDWLYRALHRTGFANQAESIDRDDGLVLTGAYITAGARCAPPANKPTPAERDACRDYLDREIDLLQANAGIRCVVPLGKFAYDQTLRVFGERGYRVPKPKPKFGHAAEATLVSDGDGPLVVVASFHPSQQNTFTGRLTEDMLDAVFWRARRLVDGK
jgi:uracil-DNA glycosylase family 4